MGKKGRLLREQTEKGTRPLKVEVPVRSPMMRCRACGIVFPDYRADEHVKTCEKVKEAYILRMQIAEKLKALGVQKTPVHGGKTD